MCTGIMDTKHQQGLESYLRARPGLLELGFFFLKNKKIKNKKLCSRGLVHPDSKGHPGSPCAPWDFKVLLVFFLHRGSGSARAPRGSSSSPVAGDGRPTSPAVWVWFSSLGELEGTLGPLKK